MLHLRSLRIKAAQINALLDDFEGFCLGKRHLRPEQFIEINEELSIGAVLSIGRNRLEWHADGNHLIWTAPDRTEHDLGALEKINVMRDYPGFHRGRSLCLGHDDVSENDVLNAPGGHWNISMVKLKDGSTGYGPNYKIALRNAALKMHLKRQFALANPMNFWKNFCGNA
jgi:hypothetical protein